MHFKVFTANINIPIMLYRLASFPGPRPAPHVTCSMVKQRVLSKGLGMAILGHTSTEYSYDNYTLSMATVHS